MIAFYTAWPFYTGAREELGEKRLGMMVLVSLAVLAGYFYSVGVGLFAPEQMDFYWEISTLIAILLLGHWLEMKAVVGTGNALQELAKLIPPKANLLRGGEIIEVETGSLAVDDKVLVRPGGKIPVDGKVVNGTSSVNEAMISGESKPVTKNEGDMVIGGTINIDGALTVEVAKTGQDTALAQIMALIAQAQDTKPKVQKLADKAAHYLTLTAIIVGLLTLLIWTLFLNQSFLFAITLTITVVVIACPHALGLAIPTVSTITSALAAKNGILIKDMTALEAAEKIDCVVFDKTGTLTKGEFILTDILTQNLTKPGQAFTGAGRYDEDKILSLAFSLSLNSEHPVSKAVVRFGKQRNLSAMEITGFANVPGRGVKAAYDHLRVLLGNRTLMQEYEMDLSQAEKQARELQNEGKTVSFLGVGSEIRAVFAFADEIKQESKQAVQELKAMGIKVAMLTGDNKQTANYVAGKLGLNNFFAEIKPEQKNASIKELQALKLSVMMVGDGVNDAPALAQANVGVAIGAGTDVAIESAQIVLIKNNPLDVVKLIKLSKITRRKMLQNLFWATAYNVVAIPLAAGVLMPIGLMLRPEWGAMLMTGSSIVVVANALSLKKEKLS